MKVNSTRNEKKKIMQKKAKNVTYTGQLLYLSAIQQLQVLEKKFTTNGTSSTPPKSFTDRVLRHLTRLWSPVIPSTYDQTLDILKQNEFTVVINTLEKSAREFNNHDALLLLADLNFVKHPFFFILKTRYLLFFF